MQNLTVANSESVRTSGRKWAILYGTWCGSSRDAAVWIAEGMGGNADVLDIRQKPDLSEYDHLIIGSSIRGFRIHPDLEQYISDHKDLIQDKIRGYWAICNNMGQTPGAEQKKAYIDDHLARLCGVSDLPSRVFHGRITKDLLDEQVRAMMQSLPDNDNLKRSDCLSFGKEILASVRAG